MDNERELAWAAGFFDGEGSTFVRHTLKHKGGTTGKMYPLLTVEISVAQVRREPLDRFLAAVNLGTINGPYKSTNGQPYYRWQTSGRGNVHKVLCVLWPFLSIPKKEQAQKCWKELLEKRTNKSPKLKELPI